jgi:hypothetical protein
MLLLTEEFLCKFGTIHNNNNNNNNKNNNNNWQGNIILYYNFMDFQAKYYCTDVDLFHSLWCQPVLGFMDRK